MSPFEVSPCPVCGEHPMVRAHLFMLEELKVHGKRRYKKERRVYLRCPCDSVVTEWHAATCDANGRVVETAEESASKEWEAIVSRLTRRK